MNNRYKDTNCGSKLVNDVFIIVTKISFCFSLLICVLYLFVFDIQYVRKRYFRCEHV